MSGLNINQSPQMRGDKNIGFWGPPTASIDWCEANYVYSFYVAELWNTVSSFMLAFWSIIGLVLAIRQGLEMRVYIGNLMVILVGLGSVAFHATLLYDLQMWDEIPMVWLILSWYYALWNLYSPQGRSNYWVGAYGLFVLFVRLLVVCALSWPIRLILSWYYALWNLYSPQGRSNSWVALVLVAYGILWAYIHYMGAYTVEFQIHFAIIAIIASLRLIHLWWFRPKDYQFGYMIPSFLVAICLALTSWVIDQTMCDTINSSLPFNPQLHAIWHLLCSITIHFGVQYTLAMRMIFLGYKPITTKIIGMPYVVPTTKGEAEPGPKEK